MSPDKPTSVVKKAEPTEDMDLASFANESVKISINPEKVGEAVGEFVKRAATKAVEKVLKKNK